MEYEPAGSRIGRFDTPAGTAYTLAGGPRTGSPLKTVSLFQAICKIYLAMKRQTAKAPEIKKLRSLIPHALEPDRRAARRTLNRLAGNRKSTEFSPGQVQQLHRLAERLRKSVAARHARIKNRPVPEFPPELPITAKKNEIIAAIRRHPVVIVSGETGSGKTTQIPKCCLEAGRGIDGLIGCTQPRRIAATSVARRIAAELGEVVGDSVGYKIRFHEKTAREGYIKMMTDGVLLAEAQGDPWLNGYDTLIVDEAHERSLNIDFLLGILKNLLRKRKDLKLVITSATIDTEKFSKAFGNAPVVEVSGRMYPVDVHYLADEGRQDPEELSHIELAVQAVERIQSENPFGDILIFMPTEQGIRETVELIEGRKYKGVTILPLFARLTAAQQARVFAPAPGRKIIVATNIAETSITIPGIRYVVDTGLARISRYMPRSRTTALPVAPISKSSADQRMGRCGRVANGVCYRLYTEAEYEARPLYTSPEILRANLAEVILRMISLKLGNVETFPFIDPPAQRNIKDGIDLLVELGAVVPAGTQPKKKASGRLQLTATGRMMARLPIDPRLARMLVAAREHGCIADITIVAAALSIQDPRERPADSAQAADQAQKGFVDPLSDLVTLLNIWQQYHDTWKQEKTTGRMKKWCKAHFLSFRRMREWRDVHYQIREILRENRFNRKPAATAPVKKTAKRRPAAEPLFGERYTAIHKSALSGFLSNIAVQREKNFFSAAKGREVMVFPGSGLFDRSGRWIMAVEMVETSRLFARICARIDSGWLEATGRNLCRYTHLDPHWERNRGEVVATEQVSLFGLVIVADRRVSYGRVNPAHAAELFIRQALVEGDIRRPPAFIKHNRDLVDGIRDMEDRVRRRDILVHPDEMAAFYQARLETVYDIRTLKALIKKRGGDNLLKMTRAALLNYAPEQNELDQYPDSIKIGAGKFGCTYRFRPDGNDDGVTIEIPAVRAAALPTEEIDWLVPGLFRDKVEALVRGLPKKYRKQLVPVSGTVEVIAAEMPREEGALTTALSRFIHDRLNVDIPAAAWPVETLPEHLKARLTITDARGRQIESSRDPAILKKQTAKKEPQAQLARLRARWEKSGITAESFPDLPESIEAPGPGPQRWIVYPALVVESDQVVLRLLEDPDKARTAHCRAVRQLYSDYFSKDLNFLRRKLLLPEYLAPATRPFGGNRALEKQLEDTLLDSLFANDIRNAKAFQDHAAEIGPKLMNSGDVLVTAVKSVVAACSETQAVLEALRRKSFSSGPAAELLDTLFGELHKLVPANFVNLYETARMPHVARYVKALAIRAQRALDAPDRDRQKAALIAVHTDRLNELLADFSPVTSAEKRRAVEAYFWLIEEYKVSQFAQELGTVEKVSAKRLDRLHADILRIA